MATHDVGESQGTISPTKSQDGDQGDVWLPLYEAKLIHQFDHRFATYTADGKTRDTTVAEHTNPGYASLPRYWLPMLAIQAAAAGSGEHVPPWMLIYRLITRATDERTTIACVSELVGTNNSIGGIVLPNQGIQQLLLATNLNTYTLDFVARQKVGGINYSFFIFKQLPVLPPETYTPELLDLIVFRVLELTYTAHDLAPFARDCGYDGPPFVWDDERRAQLRAELDGIYAHLYGLSRDDFAYILDTFPIVRRNDERAFGEFRTKRLCLEAYDYFAPEALERLDRDIKRIEVRLRSLIRQACGPSTAAVPSELHARLVERLHERAGGRPDAASQPPLGTLLETCTLLDLQKILLADGNWPAVASRFGSKTALRDAFSHLNEPRNALAHSRAMSERDRRKGEDAVRWFSDALGLS